MTLPGRWNAKLVGGPFDGTITPIDQPGRHLRFPMDLEQHGGAYLYAQQVDADTLEYRWAEVHGAADETLPPPSLS